MDCQTLIVEIANAFLAVPNSYENITSLIDATIDDYVGQNDIETNQKIVIEYGGGVYEAIQLYEFHLGNACDLHKSTKSKFYQQLAYVSLFVKLYPQIKSIVDAETSTFVSEITMSDMDDDDNADNIFLNEDLLSEDEDDICVNYEFSSDDEDTLFSWKNTNSDIAAMLNETIKSYKKHKAAEEDDLYSDN
jgi:hypothetical protein